MVATAIRNGPGGPSKITQLLRSHGNPCETEFSRQAGRCPFWFSTDKGLGTREWGVMMLL
jgi:hypothetical protein